MQTRTKKVENKITLMEMWQTKDNTTGKKQLKQHKDNSRDQTTEHEPEAKT